MQLEILSTQRIPGRKAAKYTTKHRVMTQVPEYLSFYYNLVKGDVSHFQVRPCQQKAIDCPGAMTRVISYDRLPVPIWWLYSAQCLPI